jgi:hypothetical protein
VDSLVFGWLRETILPMLIKELAESHEAYQDVKSSEELLPEPDRYDNALPAASSPHQAVLFGPLSGKVCHLKWWLTKYFADHVDIFHR